MASASVRLKWHPGTLYNSSLNVIAHNYKHISSELHIYPPAIHFDVLHKLYEFAFLPELTKALSNVEIITKALRAPCKRLLLHRCFQAVMDNCFCQHQSRASHILAESYVKKCKDFQKKTYKEYESLVLQGLAIATFMSEAGWLEEAEIILVSCQSIVIDSDNPQEYLKSLEISQRLLHVQNAYCRFEAAQQSCNVSLQIAKRLQTLGHHPNLASLYSEISTLYMSRSNYTEAYNWSVKSLKELLVSSFHRTALVDILRQAAKSCVLKREFKKAGLLIKQAVMVAKELYGEKHPKYADSLIDFGFYLLNVDAISQAIQVYQTALDVRQNVFGGINLHVAIAHEDMSYASYVHNYSRGTFDNARNQAEKAIELLLQLLPNNHLLLSSSKRVKALILEEMAIDNPNKEIEAKYLEEAHCLHHEALRLALQAFGEMNVQTAKHYGNLGRLYQSMRKYKKAEEMHLKAIQIKEELLGPDDYEVALSVGHLASLYNYDLGYYSKAEMLYLRSINIGIKLFGEAYSGLEYDYRGLLRVYTNQYDMEKRSRYINILTCWKGLRERAQENVSSPFSELKEPINIDLTIEEFMTL